MSFSYDPKTKKGRIRLVIADTNEDNRYFDDDEIEAFLAMEDGEWKLAAARALETMASSETIILKVVTSQDTQTNGPQVAADLRKAAQQLRKDYEEEGGFAIVEQANDMFSARELVWKDMMRRAK
ncbi:hypothetical protein [Alkalicoccus chagannorensis]|uniref:hypothetical protein n=1 Tax=Alkalicoccus chagannorensis TaxID=427072 RepID=UPI0004274272|nr:hypothetical protein [Alkalicoccus chagannorensis]